MPTVTDIKLKKNKKSYEVYVDDEFFMEADAETIYKADIIKGQSKDKKSLENAKEAADGNKAYSKSLGFIAYMSRTEKEVQDYLLKNGFSVDASKRAVDKLKSYNFINDEEYATRFVKNKAEFGDQSAKKAYTDLIKKGIVESTAKSAIEKYFTREHECKIAFKEAGKLNFKYARDPYRKKCQKVSQRLAVKGFGFDIISEAVKMLDNEGEESEEFKRKFEKSFELALKKYQKKGLKNYDLQVKVIQAMMSKGYEYDKVKKHLASCLADISF
jgi:regulatory protein